MPAPPALVAYIGKTAIAINKPMRGAPAVDVRASRLARVVDAYDNCASVREIRVIATAGIWVIDFGKATVAIKEAMRGFAAVKIISGNDSIIIDRPD